MPAAAAIYARISSDPLAQALGVQRQIEDCQREASRRGWPVAEVYVDNDVSAYSAKRRPEYQRLLDDVEEKRRDAVLVYRLDRLHRQPRELEDFAEVCDRAGMRHLATVQGDVNIGTGDGLLIARIMGSVAAHESEVKGERVRRKMLANAQAGRPHGPARPFGYQADKVSIEPAEASIVKDLAERLLAGESLSSLVRWLNDNDIPTVTGRGDWRTSTLRNLLLSGRISGQRDFNGETVGRAVWPAIITEQQTTRIRAMLTDPARRTNRTARRYPLAGMLRCQLCGAVLLAHPRSGVRRYVCKSGADFTGCGRIYIAADPVEQLIVDGVLFRLDSPAMTETVTARSSSDQEAALLVEQMDADHRQMTELAELYGHRQISVTEWSAARRPIEARIAEAKNRAARLTGTTAISQWVGNADALRAQWSGLNFDRQRAIVRAVLDHAVIAPRVPGSNDFRPERVRPIWTL